MNETPENKNTKIKAMTANMEALKILIKDAAVRIDEAYDYIQKGEQNMAIGTILDFDDLLAEVAALYKATSVLHRSKFAR
jgi:hypothetical protein